MKVNGVSEFDQPCAFRRRGGTPIKPEPFSGEPQQRGITLRFRCGQRQQGLCFGRQLGQPLGEGEFKFPAQWDAIRTRQSLYQFRGRPRPWELQQRKRIPSRFGEDPIAHCRVNGPGDNRIEQRSRVVHAEAPES